MLSSWSAGMCNTLFVLRNKPERTTLPEARLIAGSAASFPVRETSTLPG
jgi:hypothetical protein